MSLTRTSFPPRSPRSPRSLLWCVVCCCLSVSLSLSRLTHAQPSAPKTTSTPLIRLPQVERPTIQQRFAPRAKAFALWLGGVGHVRDDYYSSWGVSAAASYMWSDSYGLELSARHLWTSLSDEAVALRDSYGLTPDARPQSWAYSIGLLLGAGYAKALLGAGVTHIDPIIGLHLGLAHADERLIPTLRGVISPVLLMRDGLKVRLELAATVQFEQRERGLVMSTGFLPGLSVGWGETTKALRERVFPSKPTPLKKTQTSPSPKAAR